MTCSILNAHWAKVRHLQEHQPTLSVATQTLANGLSHYPDQDHHRTTVAHGSVFPDTESSSPSLPVPPSVTSRHTPSSAHHNAGELLNRSSIPKVSNEKNFMPRPESGPLGSAEALPSDTQVVSQSVYDSIIRQNVSAYADASQTGADVATLMTLNEGDSGHIDLLAGFESNHQDQNVSPAHDDESNYDGSESSPMPYQPELFPESQRFMAETPGTTMKKPPTPGTLQTPSLSRNPLAGDIESSGGFMALSQAFHATQACSSPLVNALQSEIVSDRPSPNIPIQPSRIHNTASSPLLHFARESSEPNMNYISMQESQNRRDRTLGERLTRSADHVSDPLDLEFQKESSFVQNARRQRERDRDTAAQFAALHAPSSTSHERTTSPVLLHENTDVVMPEAPGSEEETEQEDEPAPQVPQSQEVPQSSEEDKENYVGPHDTVIGTGSAHDRLSQALAMEPATSSRVEASVEDSSAGIHHSAGAPEDQVHYSGRSSQDMVKNSQQTPQPSPKQSNEAKLSPVPEYEDIRQNQDNARSVSPIRRRVRLSPPLSRSTANSLPPPNPLEATENEDVLGNTSFKENRPLRSSNTSEQTKLVSQPSHSHSGLGDKLSSMPSRITETPVHLRPTVSDMARLTRIPETSPNRNQNNESDMDSSAGANDNEDDDLPPMLPSQNTHRFSQARPSQSRALSSPLKVLQSQAVPQVLSSPSGRQRRRLTEIASEGSPIVDFKMTDFNMEFLTAEDDDFNSLIIDGSPTRPRKKRRGNLGQSFHTSDTAPATPRPPKTVAPTQGVNSSQKVPSPISQVPATTVRRQATVPRRDENVWEIGSSPQQPILRRRSRHRLKSTRQPEERHRSEERRQAVPKPEAKKPALHRPVVIHNPEPVAQPQREPESTPAAEPEAGPEPGPEPQPEPTLEPQPSQTSELTGVESDDQPFSDNILPSESNSVNSPPTTPRAVRVSSDNAQIAPRQVLAIWMGQKRAYFPATCFGTPIGVSHEKYSVKFEDSLPVEVVKGMVKRLEFRIGDAVKVDMPGVPKVTHIVRGFDDRLTRDDLIEAAEKGFYPQTDVYGHATLILGPKQRKSLPNGGLNSSENVIKVPIARIYLDSILWNQLKDNAFTYQPEIAPRENSVHTPSEKSSLPASPSVRLSRTIQSASGIFANMAFAISYIEDDGSKNRITKMITDNGGSILNDGFTELFEPSSIFPSNTPNKGKSANNENSHGLQLTSLAENVGFSCLIADSHSRRAKYMQALALGLPCLNGRWIEDCVAKRQILKWDIYLLPAGESMYLNGATKSRVMAPSSPSDALLPNTIASRPKPLEGQSVLIVTGRGKAEEKRKAYIFLTFALGASRVERVPDLETARASLESQSEASLPCTWDLIYVDDADQPAAQAMLTPRPKTQRISLSHGKSGKKRRKSSAIFPMLNSSQDIPSETPAVKVVGNEFVCQSLILGRLMFDE